MSHFNKLWSRSCENYAVSKDVAMHWHHLIETKYSTESNRYQHNFHLLEKKCKFLYELRETITFADYIVFTLAFQYYHFDSNALCCDMNCSAFREFYGEAGINDHILLHSVLTLLDCAHGCDKTDPDSDLYQDLDLIDLGSDPNEYLEYRGRLRKEYAHLNDSIYTQLRTKVLKSLLQIPQIYRVTAINDELGDKAKRNIEHELSELAHSDEEYV